MTETKNKLEFYIPGRHKVGAIIRTNDNKQRFSILKDALNSVLKIDSINLISIIITSDNRESELRRLLIDEFGSQRKRVEIALIHAGDFYTDILNISVNEQTRRGIDYSFIISAEAWPYATKENIDKILLVAQDAYYSIGLILDEYKDISLSGYVSNAFCLYRNTKVNFTNIWLLKALIKNSHIDEKHFGMEEVYITKSILENYGESSVAIVHPTNGHLIEPEDHHSKTWRTKMHNSKRERFNEMCELLQVNKENLIKKIDIIE